MSFENWDRRGLTNGTWKTVPETWLRLRQQSFEHIFSLQKLRISESLRFQGRLLYKILLRHPLVYSLTNSETVVLKSLHNISDFEKAYKFLQVQTQGLILHSSCDT